MKRYHIVPYLLLSLLVCLIFGSVLLIYVPPMEDVSLDLSLGVQEDVMFIDPEDYDEKGWAVYTQDGDIRTDLTPDGFDGYTGLELGQTFYFSRVMEEDLDSPTLQIIPLESTFAVWLDDTLLYTDNPNLDLRIGHLTLPMNEWLREEAITVTLPPDYAGKTLTVAQSFPEYSETGSVRAYPTAVRLYCGYAYESALISESFRVAFAALMLFAAGVLLAAGAVYLHDISMMCLALTAFLYMTRTLIGTSFYWNYFGTYENSPLFNLPSYAAITLFVFLLLQAKKHRTALAVIMGLYTALVTANSIMMLVLPYMAPGHHLTVILFFILPPWLLLLGIILLLVLSGVFWQHESRLYKLFFPIACTVIPLILIGYALTAGLETVRMQMLTSITETRADLLSSLLLIAVDIAALISALTVAVSTVLRRRAEAAAMAEHRDLLVGSYENMRHQNEEVMRLRHDMVSHYETLRGIVGDGPAGAYLDDLIGKNKKIRSVVQTGNHMLDIILNNKLGAAADLGIRCEIVRANAPEHLPLSDADICSLVMNILNNAITAANISSDSEPYIRLDIHVKNDFFALTCENSRAAEPIPAYTKEETVPRHGLGMKIVRSIVKQHGGLMETAAEERQYTVRIAIPLFQTEISR